MAEYYNWTSQCGDIVQDYYEAPSVSQVSEKPTSAGHVEGNYPQWGDEQCMNLVQRMVYDATGPSYFASYHEGVPDDGTRSVIVDVITSSYVYGSDGPYDYDESELRSRNVQLGLCTDGFAPHGQYSRTYSCWSIIITQYNLSPGMCMSSEYMFRMIVIPDPSNLKRMTDVYLEPLIEELL
ncbi:UNVERIFIED_CONTAM: hypothetical protein Sangu_3238900 [Sesamum angustifolium]|uniref:Uncharacterized protein n=1 Tax=Sesamum angustifolium TaxID=2727405 RepID=A0AAW2JII6_9LAMI